MFRYTWCGYGIENVFVQVIVVTWQYAVCKAGKGRFAMKKADLHSAALYPPKCKGVSLDLFGFPCSQLALWLPSRTRGTFVPLPVTDVHFRLCRNRAGRLVHLQKFECVWRLCLAVLIY